MYEASRASGTSRPRWTQPTSEAWHELSRYVLASRTAPPKRSAHHAGEPDSSGG